MKKIIISVIAAVFLAGAVSAANWENDKEWSNFSESEFNWSDDWMDDPFFQEEPKFPEITVKEPKIVIQEPVIITEESVLLEDKVDDPNETEGFSGNLTFQDQALSNGSVTVEEVNTGQESTLIVTYDQEDELVVAGLESIDEINSEDINISIEDAGGFPGEHTAHVIPTEELSTDYEVGDNVSEETAENILDSETANITEQETAPPSGQLEFNDQSLSENATIVVENVSTGQNSTLILTYPKNGFLTIAGLESADNVQNRNVELEVGDANGFPGNHTAHVVPDEGLSSDYNSSDNVSEQTASNILESETALIE